MCVAFVAYQCARTDGTLVRPQRSWRVSRKLCHPLERFTALLNTCMIYASKVAQPRGKEEEEGARTVDSAVGSGPVAESTSLNIDVQSEAQRPWQAACW